jgi:hypothetical protein
MRHHDLRIALAAMVAFGPLVFTGVYGIANAGRLQPAAAVPAPASVASPAFPPARMTERTPGKDRHLQGVLGASIAAAAVTPAGLDRPPAPRPGKQATRQTHEPRS